MDAYLRTKRDKQLQPQSIVTMAKQIIAFFNWCITEEYLEENPLDKVALPKVPKKKLQGFTAIEVNKMINSFSYSNYIESRNKAIIAMMEDCELRAMEIRGITGKRIKELGNTRVW